MIDWITKIFVKDYQNTDDVNVRTAYVLFAGIVGISCNLLLFGAKVIVGLLINSISVTADAFNNLSDAASSIIGFVGVKMAGKPADEDHPFGHGRIEYIAAFIVAFIVIQVGFSLFKTSVGKVRNPENLSFNLISIIILLLSICVKLWMSIFNRTLGKRIHSKILTAVAADSMGDVVTTGATILSIVVFGIWGLNIDGIVGLVVSVFVMVAGVNIARDTLAPLIGEVIDPKIYKEITELVESYDGIVGTHDLIVHNYGQSKSMASIHAEVPRDVNIEMSHEVVDRIERDCARRLGIFLVIHMDPVEVFNERVTKFREMVTDVLSEIDPRLHFHDFRVVDGTQRVNLIFDLVVPREYNMQLRDTIKRKVSEVVQERNPQCYCMLTVENSFCAEIPEND